MGFRHRSVRVICPSAKMTIQGDGFHSPDGEVKPNPKVLMDIISEIGEKVEHCAYVGDSLYKDMVMARNAGVDGAWAKYGVAHQAVQYELLREVTHWTAKEVQIEKAMKEQDIKITLQSEFREILDSVDFGISER